jgi:hypothetical protein
VVSTIVTTLQDLPRELRGLERNLRTAVKRGALIGARAGKKILARKTPGALKAGWSARAGSGPILATLHNGAPLMGVIELGARPHTVSVGGRARIYKWVWKTRGAHGVVPKSGRAQRGKAAEKAVNAIVAAIVRTIERHGRKPTYLVRNSLPELLREAQEGVEWEMRVAAGKRGNL